MYMCVVVSLRQTNYLINYLKNMYKKILFLSFVVLSYSSTKDIDNILNQDNSKVLTESHCFNE